MFIFRSPVQDMIVDSNAGDTSKSSFQAPFKANLGSTDITHELAASSNNRTVKIPVYIPKAVIHAKYTESQALLRRKTKSLENDGGPDSSELVVGHKKHDIMAKHSGSVNSSKKSLELSKSSVLILDSNVNEEALGEKKKSETSACAKVNKTDSSYAKSNEHGVNRRSLKISKTGKGNDVSMVTKETVLAMETGKTAVIVATRETAVARETCDIDIDPFSQGHDEEDIYYCMLAEAREFQRELIAKKKGLSVQPIKGRLLSMKESANQRWTLKQVVDWNGDVSII